ncbi:STAS domain-containing protein [Streptomyces sp. NPDC058655]|uniref:STAS domain-containing protein n=1 Tax=unclassified Streptomyces TaxID=2593676 RepID=UPI0036689343
MTEQPASQAGGGDITVDVLDHSVVVRPVGEIDIESVSSLRLALSTAATHSAPDRPVVIDCSRLTFCDSSGLNALLTARRTAQEADTVIRLASPNHQLQRLLEMTGTLTLFAVDLEPTA